LEKKGQICIPLVKGEHNISRTCVIPQKGGYEASYDVNAGESYRIGYAKSDDGLDWFRLDEEAGICLSNTGWDFEVQSYPYVIDCDLGRLMLYNVRSFEKTGFGIAKFE